MSTMDIDYGLVLLKYICVLTCLIIDDNIHMLRKSFMLLCDVVMPSSRADNDVLRTDVKRCVVLHPLMRLRDSKSRNFIYG